jgi:hypothetical protein
MGLQLGLPDWPGFHWVALLISVMSTCFHLMFYLMSAGCGGSLPIMRMVYLLLLTG